jgi:hypothetical protein
VTLGGYNDDGASAQRAFTAIEGRKENGTTGNSAGYLNFKTNNAGTLTAWMRLSSTGRLGVGSSSPTYGLSFDNVTGTAATSTISNGSGTHPSCLQVYAPNGTAYRVYVTNAGTLTAVAGSCN